MGFTIEDMYKDLLDQEGQVDLSDKITGRPVFGTSVFDEDDDSEDFLTSADIVKLKEKEEEKFGPINNPNPEIEEEVDFKRYNKRHQHKYTESEMKAIRESCVETIVHDYGENDIFHMSDEQRAENDMLAELSMKLGCLKRIYRQVDQYIEAMRVVVQAWELLEKNNYVHTREEFFKMVSEGRIVCNRIIMPKLKKADSYNMDLIIKYISNPELDASELVPKKPQERDPWYDQFMEDDEDYETEEEELMRLLSPEEVEYILNNEDNPPEIEVHDIKQKWIKGYDRRSITKKKKKENKKERYFREGLHDILNKIQTNIANNSDGYTRSSLVTHSIFEQEKLESDVFDNLRYDGSWADKDSLILYDILVREEILKQHPIKERYLTYADKELQQFFTDLENNGVNTIDLRRKMDYSDDSYIRLKAEKKKKENKRIESQLLQRITKLNDSAKFKKLAEKAEKALNEQYKEY